ncbi:MAG TPA: hypothetical protein VFH88_07110 [Candidatus Krumholzibacteria bacterium]|nr:hypothetical protein [Candidatus Krumholzibacteria bacterium]
MSPGISRSVLAGACIWILLAAGCGGSSNPAAPADNSGPPVYIYAGTGAPGYGQLGLAPRDTRLYSPQDVVFSPDDAPFIVDWNNHRILEVMADADTTRLIAGVADGDFGDPCVASPTTCTDIVAADAKLNHPTDLAFLPDGRMVMCAWHNSELFIIDPTTGLMNRICGNGARSYNGDNQPAVDAYVDLPVSVAIDPQGRVVFCDQGNMIIRRIEDDGTIVTIAGIPPVLVNNALQYQFGFTGNEGPATQARLSFNRGQIASPSGRVAYDRHGNLFIADTQNNCIRYVDTNGIIHQFAGVGLSPGYAGDGGPATAALLRQPRDIAIDNNDNVYIADTDNHVVRMVDSNGTIYTVVGVPRPEGSSPLSPSEVLAQNGKGAHSIRLTHPYGIALDPSGRLWIVDTEDSVILFRDRK